MLAQNSLGADLRHPETRPLTGHFGAEILGVDLTQPIDEATAEAIRATWVDAGVLLFRNVRQNDAAQLQLSRLFGELEPSATPQLNDPDNPFMMTLAHDPDDAAANAQHYSIGGIDRAGWLGWHWDQSFMPTIVRGAVLRMVQPAAEMGQTGFIDAIGAYDRLPDALRDRIEGLEVVYQFNPDFASGQFGFPADLRALPRQSSGSGQFHDFPPVVHPMVITQAETGRKVLKLSPMHARYILGMDRDESDALLAQVADHLVDPAHAYFHDWEENDLVAWDNWRVIHSATGVPLHCTRRARRTTIVGDYNVGRYLDPTLDRDRKVKRLVD